MVKEEGPTPELEPLSLAYSLERTPVVSTTADLVMKRALKSEGGDEYPVPSRREAWGDID